MREYSLRFDVAAGENERLSEEEIDRLLEALDVVGAQAPIPSVSPFGVSVRFSLPDDAAVWDAAEAIERGARLLRDALAKCGLAGLPIVEAEAQDIEVLESAIGEPMPVPELVGVTEVAGMLGVTRQRASELARSREFPAPVAMLAAGPVWRKSQVLRHARRWERKAGRPRRS